MPLLSYWAALMPPYTKSEVMMKKIHIASSSVGKLHKKLGVPMGKKIPEGKLEKAAHSKSPALRKEANFALNARKWK